MLRCTMPDSRIPGGWLHCKNDSVLHGLCLLQYDAASCLVTEQSVEQIFVKYMSQVHNILHCMFLHVFLISESLKFLCTTQEYSGCVMVPIRRGLKAVPLITRCLI
jgi:hypothetical protein